MEQRGGRRNPGCRLAAGPEHRVQTGGGGGPRAGRAAVWCTVERTGLMTEGAWAFPSETGGDRAEW